MIINNPPRKHQLQYKCEPFSWMHNHNLFTGQNGALSNFLAFFANHKECLLQTVEMFYFNLVMWFIWRTLQMYYCPYIQMMMPWQCRGLAYPTYCSKDGTLNEPMLTASTDDPVWHDIVVTDIFINCILLFFVLTTAHRLWKPWVYRKNAQRRLLVDTTDLLYIPSTQQPTRSTYVVSWYVRMDA